MERTKDGHWHGDLGTCWKCGVRHDCFEEQQHGGPPNPIKSAVVCGNCAAFNIVGTDLKLRKPWPWETAELGVDRRAQRARGAVLRYVSRNN